MFLLAVVEAAYDAEQELAVAQRTAARVDAQRPAAAGGAARDAAAHAMAEEAAARREATRRFEGLAEEAARQQAQRDVGRQAQHVQFAAAAAASVADSTSIYYSSSYQHPLTACKQMR